MSITRLMSGAFDLSQKHEGEIPSVLTKRALLVYEGDFEAMDGPVKVTDKELKLIEDSHNSMVSKLSRLATGNNTHRFNPPLQLDHSTKAIDTVGRLVGNLERGTYETQDGKTVAALYGTPMILGRENVEKVLDGRWSNLSVGVDFKTGKLSELTITPFSAAPEASFLKSGLAATSDDRTESTDKGVKEVMLTPEEKLAAEKAEKEEKMWGDRCKKHLMDADKMSEKDADEKLAKMTDDEKKELRSKLGPLEDWAKEEEKEHKMAAAQKDHETKMSAAKEQFSKLAAGFRSAQAEVKLQARKADLQVRMSALRAAGKVTPAEIKKTDFDAVAKLSDGEVKAMLDTYEKREPVVLTGMIGSTSGANPADAYKQAQLTKMSAEIRSNMPFTSKALQSTSKMGAPVPGMEKQPEGASPLAQPEPMPPQQDHLAAYSMAHKLLTEGKVSEALAHLKKCMDGAGPGMPAGESGEMMAVQMSALADSVKKMENEFEQVIKLAAETVGAEKF